MARRSLTTDTVVRDGLALAPVPVTADGDVIDAGNTVLVVANAALAPATVTVLATSSQDGLEVEDQIVAVAAESTVLLGPWPVRTFGQPADAVESGSDDSGRVYVDYSTTTDLASQVVSQFANQ